MALTGIIRGKIKRPLLMCLYGTEGVGKTTFAAKAEVPIFIGPETGTDDHDVARFPTPKTFEEILTQVKSLLTETHEFKTMLFDSLDWIEGLLHRELVDKFKAKSIEDIGGGYGRYVALVNNEWMKLIELVKELRETKKMNAVFIAHYHVKVFNDPMTALPYDRYQMKLLEKTSVIFREFVDVLGFATFDVVSRGSSDRATKGKGMGEGARVLYTEKRPSHDAKNRFSLPYVLPLDFTMFIEKMNMGTEDKVKEIRQDIIDLMLDLTDKTIVEKITEAMKDEKLAYATLVQYKNRIITILNGGKNGN